ncbi:MAG TPA: GNAT family N-acetyltransferase, partial [Thermoanaerobaculia bacterium]|nr:GNAT family N-acetyltransferase [Thermoanaerobaculia bacterium]
MGSTELTVRDVEGIAEMRRVGELQQRIADWNEHTAPLVQLIASCEVGAILIGAFDGESLAGFVYGFPGYRGGRRIVHSHMLAVDPGYRQLDLGYRLKVAQRERAIAEGVDEITWTFDPLRSMNAYLNVNRLGVVAESYRPAYYGESCAAAARHIGTDRIWVRWQLDSERVRRRLEEGSSSEATRGRLETALPLVRQG